MDAGYIFIWWLLFLILGIVSLPFTYIFFKKFTDIGYGFSKTIGLLLIGYLLFLGGILKILPFTSFITYLVFVLWTAVNVVIFIKKKKEIVSFIKKKYKIIILQEILFALGLVGWSIIRGYAPDIRGLEKFMDLGFVNALLRTKYLPAIDMWFAGQSLNYYWFGHFITAVATKLSTLSSFVTYNLMIATILGLLINGAFSLVSTLISSLSTKITGKMISAGIISLLLVAFAGSLHTPIYLLKNGFDKYWYPDATRFVGYFPETNDKTIHEFPIYSFVVSDLHGHLLDVPFTILFLGLLWAVASEGKNTNWFKRIKNYLFPGFVLGCMFITNTWDFGSYLIVSAVVIFFLEIIPQKPSWKNFGKAALDTLATISVLLLAGIIAALPFILNFSSMVQGINFVHSQTPLWQLGVLWGFPAILSLCFLLLVFTYLKDKIKKADIFVLAILFASWILILIPETIYIKDIYIATHYRANTMFKVTYQAYVMFYLTSGYIAVRIISSAKNLLSRSIFVLFLSILFTSLLIYPFMATSSYYGKLKNYQGLSGEKWVTKIYPESYNIITWLNDNVKGQPVILEAPGNSYTDYNLISSYTGLPTIQGWFVHEWLWRGGSEEPAKRNTDIEKLYLTANLSVAQKIIDQYQIKYVIVGSFEREKYPLLNEAKFAKLGKKVFSSGRSVIYFLDNPIPKGN